MASALPSDALALRGLPAAQARAAPAVFGSPETLVAFESPRRIGASLAVLAELDPERPVAVCRELTKLHEEIVRGSAAELAARYAGEPPRGEIVLVVGGAPAPTGVDPAAVEAVRTLVESGARAKTAAKVVAELTGARRTRSTAPSPPGRCRSSPPPCATPRGSGRARCPGPPRASESGTTRPGRPSACRRGVPSGVAPAVPVDVEGVVLGAHRHHVPLHELAHA